MTRLGRCLVVSLSLVPTWVYSADAPVPASEPTLDFGQNLSGLPVDKLLQMSGALGVVLVLIVALAWLLRRYGRAARGGQGELALLGGLTLGGRERLMLVRAGQDRILIGVAPGQIRTLHVLSETKASSPPHREHGDGFEKTLSGLLAREPS